MIEAQLIGRYVSDFAAVLGHPVVVPDRPPEGDPDHGLDRYIEYPDRGVAIVIDWSDVARCVQFFRGESDQDYGRYDGALPCGLRFESSRSEVREAMGQPVDSRDGGARIASLVVRPWDWFAHDGLKVHVEYAGAGEAEGVRMVSVMPLPG